MKDLLATNPFRHVEDGTHPPPFSFRDKPRPTWEPARPPFDSHNPITREMVLAWFEQAAWKVTR